MTPLPPRRATLFLTALAAGVAGACGDGAGPAGDISMTTPFVDAAAIASVNEAFSTTASAPWGFAHNGIDFMPGADFVPFQAVSSGVVEDVTLSQNSSTSNWQVNVRITYNATYSLEYIFEPFSSIAADGQAQLASVLVSSGQSLVAGDTVGSVRTFGGGAHLHFSLVKSGNQVCPEPYFTPEAGAAVRDLIHKTNPSWNMCY
jgi:murein DD-endopeptidase MepM/ murein hydrolase activator NlpD